MIPLFITGWLCMSGYCIPFEAGPFWTQGDCRQVLRAVYEFAFKQRNTGAFATCGDYYD